MKTPKKNASSAKSTTRGAKSSNIKPIDNKAGKRFDDDDDSFDADLDDDLGGFDDLDSFDDEDDY